MRWQVTATRPNGGLGLSAPALPAGARRGLVRLCLTLQGAGGVWSWQLAGLISASSHSSLLSFPVFPASPSICGILGHPWCPPASSASGQGEQGGGQHFVKLPFVFLTTFHPTPCGRASPTLPVPPRVWEKPQRTLCSPRAGIPRSFSALRFSAEVALARHRPSAEGS